MVLARALLFALFPAAALAATGEEIYKTRCSLCHDSGATQAPRISHPGDWSARLARGRQAMVDSAIRGVPNTAMTPKGGHTELSDAQIAAAVMYMLDRTGAVAGSAGAAVAKRKPLPGPSRDDAILVQEVGAAMERARIGGVKVESAKGEVTLRGIVDDADAAKRAEEAAYAIPGVRSVVNNLTSAAIFEHD